MHTSHGLRNAGRGSVFEFESFEIFIRRFSDDRPATYMGHAWSEALLLAFEIKCWAKSRIKTPFIDGKTGLAVRAHCVAFRKVRECYGACRSRPVFASKSSALFKNAR